MLDEKNKNLKISKMRTLPIALGFLASIFLNWMSEGGRSLILLSLGELTLTISLFLALMLVFNEITALIANVKLKHEQRNKEHDKATAKKTPSKFKFFEKIKAFFAKFTRAASGSNHDLSKESAENDTALPSFGDKIEIIASEPSSDLIEIHKSDFSKQKNASPAKKNRTEIITSVLYIISFACLGFWRISRILEVLPLSYTEFFRYNLMHSVLLLIFPCIAAFYVKMRPDNGTRPGDKASHDMLLLFSYVSLIYAATIATRTVLDIDILVVLQWLYYAVSAYLFAALTVNILLSILKNDVVGNFEYTFTPKISHDKNKEFLDSKEVKLHFSLKSLFTIRYTLQILPRLVLFLGLTLFLSTTIYVVKPYQQAAVYRFGRLGESSIVEKGLHFKLPWPIDRVYIYDVHRVRSMLIGYQEADGEHFLWSRPHEGGEHRLLLGNGNEVVAVNMRIVYKISDLYSYLTSFANPEAVLSAAAYESLMRRTITTTLDPFLSIDRVSFSTSISEELAEFCESKGLGLSVVQVIVESIHPPVEVANVYQRVVSALIARDAHIINARADAGRTLIEAEQQSMLAVNNAKAEQHRRVSAAQKEMAVYYAAMEAHKINPESFELIRYLDAFEVVVGGNRVYVFSPGTESSISGAVIGRLNTIDLERIRPPRSSPGP